MLLQRGRTTHSKFKIPAPSHEKSIWNIEQGSELAELLKFTQLIIWDEAPMTCRFCFETLDKSLKDIMSKYKDVASKNFGRKVIVFGGAFRQILPIIPRGSKSDIVHFAINASSIWHQSLDLLQYMNAPVSQFM